MEPKPTIPHRELYPVPEAKQLLGGIGHTNFYERVKKGDWRLVHIGRRSFMTAGEIKRILESIEEAA